MKTLEELRQEINSIDENLLSLFAKRFAVVHEVGKYKKENNLPIIDEKREQELFNRLTNKATELGISDTFIRNIWTSVLQEAYKLEK